MDTLNRPSLIKARSFAETDNDNREREPLLSPSSSDSKRSFNVWLVVYDQLRQIFLKLRQIIKIIINQNDV